MKGERYLDNYDKDEDKTVVNALRSLIYADDVTFLSEMIQHTLLIAKEDQPRYSKKEAGTLENRGF